MQEKINDPVSMLVSFAPSSRQAVQVIPRALRWRGKRYRVSQMGLYHPERRGEKRIHIFEFACETVKFRVELDPDTLEWTLVEVFYV